MDERNHGTKRLFRNPARHRLRSYSRGTSERDNKSSSNYPLEVFAKLPDLIANHDRVTPRKSNELHRNGTYSRNASLEIPRRNLKLPHFCKKLADTTYKKKLYKNSNYNNDRRFIVDSNAGVDPRTRELPHLKDCPDRPYWLPHLGKNNCRIESTLRATRAIEIKTIQRLICHSKKNLMKRSRRKLTADESSTHSHALTDAQSLSQKQFAKELAARLAKLAIERQAALPTQGEMETGDFNMPSTPKTDDKKNVILNQTNLSATQRTSETGRAIRKQPMQDECDIPVTRQAELHSAKQESNVKSTDNIQPHEASQYVSTVGEENYPAENSETLNYYQTSQMVSTVTTYLPKQVNTRNAIRSPKKENRGCVSSNQLNVSSGGGDTVQTADTDELDCLEDDKPAFEDMESALDASDSEVSCGEPQLGASGSLYPVIASLFPNTPSVIRFVGEHLSVAKLPKPFRNRLRWRPSAITPNVVKRALKRSHFRLTLKSQDWLGYYGNHLKPMAFRPIREFQKVNHFPGSFQLGRKDKLWNNLSRLRSQFGRKTVDFVPRTFCLPYDARLLKEVWARNDTHVCEFPGHMISNATQPRWIMKPPASARGIGVKVLRHWSDVPKQRSVIVQAYISRPYLINETKFDLRLYVYVTGFNPLRAYLHREGLVRFASRKYSTSVSDTGNRFIHLTNYSVNKHNTEEQTGVENHKWKLETLWSYLSDRCVNVDGLWAQIKDIVFKTLASVTNTITLMVDQNCRRRSCVHELFGFDIILDADLKPWLLEVNVSPSLHTNTALDNEIKTTLVTDMFNIAGFRLPPEYRSCNQSRSSHEEGSTTSADTNEASGEYPTGGTNKDTVFEDHTTAPSISESRNRTPLHPYHTMLSPEGRSSQIPILNKGSSSVKCLRNVTNSRRPAPSQSATRSKETTTQSKSLSNPLIPLSDPRLWDVQLTWDERQKHKYHSRLLCREESALRAGVTSLKQPSTQAKVNRVSRPASNSSFSRRASTTLSHRHPELTVMDELRAVVSHLTPDDVRTLIEFVDERYRASMGNFECIFPVSGDRGLQLLLFLESCAAGAQYGSLGVRSPAFRYYDLIQYAFLTVYHRADVRPRSVLRKSKIDAATISQLPDYHILQHGELSQDALLMASKMTEISKDGLMRLIELCKRGFHLSGTEAASQRVRWNQTNTAFPEKDRIAIHCRPGAPIELSAGRVKSNVQGAKGDGHAEDVEQMVDCILGGAVSFRAQSSDSQGQQLTKQISVDNIQRDSGVGASVISSTNPTPGRRPWKVLSQPKQQSGVNRSATCTQPTPNQKSNPPSRRGRPSSVAVSRCSTYTGRAMGESMGWWNRCRSAGTTSRFPDPPFELTIRNNLIGHTPMDLRAARTAILEGTYLARSDEHVDLSTVLNAQSIQELTKSVRQKRKSLEHSHDGDRKGFTTKSSSSVSLSHRNRGDSRRSSYLNALDPSGRVEQFLNAQSIQQSDTRLQRHSSRERSAGLVEFNHMKNAQSRSVNANPSASVNSKDFVRAVSSNGYSKAYSKDSMPYRAEPISKKYVDLFSNSKRVPAWM